MEIYFGTRNGFQRGVARMRDRSQAERPAAAMAKCARTSTRSTGQTAQEHTPTLPETMC